MTFDTKKEYWSILHSVGELQEKLNFALTALAYHVQKTGVNRDGVESFSKAAELLMDFNQTIDQPTQRRVFALEKAKSSTAVINNHGFIDLLRIYQNNWFMFGHTMRGLYQGRDIEQNAAEFIKQELSVQSSNLDKAMVECLINQPLLSLNFPQVAFFQLGPRLKNVLREATELSPEILKWEDHWMRFGAKEVRVPRQIAWFGDYEYRYSGIVHPAKPLPPILSEIAEELERILFRRFTAASQTDLALNGVLLNRYVDGNDSISWHSDDEASLGDEPYIVSITLGAKRAFQMREKANKRNSYLFEPGDGDCIVMYGQCQKLYEHCVPKDPTVTEPRINLTFRFTK